MGQSEKPGIYDAEGKLLRPAAYFRGLPTPHFPLEGNVTTVDRKSLELAPLSCRYYYAGHLTGHYGHFLFSVISRLWALPRPIPEDLKLVLLNGGNAQEIFELDFAREIFSALGESLKTITVFSNASNFS